MANRRPRFPHLEQLEQLGEDDLLLVRVAESGQDREISARVFADVLAEFEGLDEIEEIIEVLVAHLEDTSNPHNVTLAQLGAASREDLNCPPDWVFTLEGHPVRDTSFCVVRMGA